MNTPLVLIISLVVGKIGSIIIKAVRESKEEVKEDGQTTTGTTK